MDVAVRDAWVAVNSACNAAGIRFGLHVVEENLVGDPGCDGYIVLEGVDIYPQLIDTPLGERIGWGVSIGLDNGDVLDVCEPFHESPSILHGKVRHARTIGNAAEVAIQQVIADRLRSWSEGAAIGEMLREAEHVANQG